MSWYNRADETNVPVVKWQRYWTFIPEAGVRLPAGILKMANHANYRKHNDRTLNSSTYHKKDGTPVRGKLKNETRNEINEATKVFSVKQEISEKRIHDLLCSAFEGGTGYWCCIENDVDGIQYPEGFSYSDFRIGGRLNPKDDPVNPYGLIAMTEGMELVLSDAEDPDTRWTLNREKIQKGLQLMQEKYPSHWGDFVSENDDADTADVFLQLAVLGELVYG